MMTRMRMMMVTHKMKTNDMKQTTEINSHTGTNTSMPGPKKEERREKPNPVLMAAVVDHVEQEPLALRPHPASPEIAVHQHGEACVCRLVITISASHVSPAGPLIFSHLNFPPSLPLLFLSLFRAHTHTNTLTITLTH